MARRKRQKTPATVKQEAVYRRPKRTAEELKDIRVRISELMLTGYTASQMAEIIKRETDLDISVHQVNSDITYIRKTWREIPNLNYTELMRQELLRLDIMERELWNSLRQQRAERTRTVREYSRVRRAKKEEEEDKEKIIVMEGTGMTLNRVVKEVGSNSPDYRALELIMKVQAERRRLLGLYPSEKESTQIQTNILVKGYVAVSPDDWDRPAISGPNQIVEGEIVTG